MATVKREIALGLCKCCLKHTYVENMWYTADGQGDVYGQMLVDCFSIDWMIQGNMEDDKICNACISKLQLSVSFKERVLESQSGFLQQAGKKTVVKEEVSVEFEGVIEKVETVRGEDDEEEDDDEKGEEEDTSNSEVRPYEYVEFLEEEVAVEHIKDDDYEPEEKKPKKKPKRKPPTHRYKMYSEETMKKAVEAVREKKMSALKASEVFNVPRKSICVKLTAPDTPEKEDTSNTKEFVRAIRSILTYTNATPFRSKFNKLYCFFCPTQLKTFDNPDDLREHTRFSHDDKTNHVEFALRPHYLNHIIRFDILNLSCECGKQVEWPDLLNHLEIRHNVTDIQDAWRKIIPYTLVNSPSEDNQCALCDYTGCFMKIDTHMNMHYENYICGECGKTFVSAQRLKYHQSNHEFGEYRCNLCDAVFFNPKTRRSHVKTVHEKKLSFKCTICPKRFVTDLLKLKHLKTVHADKMATNGKTCKLCNKSFWAKDYPRHVRRKHSQYVCDQCNKSFESRHMLARHDCKGKLNKYQCDVCFKLFFTAKAVGTHKKSCRGTE